VNQTEGSAENIGDLFRETWMSATREQTKMIFRRHDFSRLFGIRNYEKNQVAVPYTTFFQILRNFLEEDFFGILLT